MRTETDHLLAYYYIVWGIWLRHCLAGRDEQFSLYWPSLLSIPEVLKVTSGSDTKPKVQ